MSRKWKTSRINLRVRKAQVCVGFVRKAESSKPQLNSGFPSAGLLISQRRPLRRPLGFAWMFCFRVLRGQSRPSKFVYKTAPQPLTPSLNSSPAFPLTSRVFVQKSRNCLARVFPFSNHDMCGTRNSAPRLLRFRNDGTVRRF
jgi:hypothetical protein